MGSFKGNATRLSLLMHDELVSPRDTAAFWVEYVLRHNGTKHLKMSSERMATYRYYLLDVAVCLGAISVAVVAVAVYVLVVLLRLLRWLVFGPKEKPVHLKRQ